MMPRVGRTANLSHRARELRYRLLEEHRAAIGATCVATAHHADDQLETMIMRLNRGSGVEGLSGIREAVGQIIRPVLEWRRSALEAVVERAGMRAVVDPTNTDERFDRARLRKQLADATWLDAERAAHSAHCLQAAEEGLRWAADRMFADHCELLPDRAVFTWTPAPKELLRRWLTRCVLHVDPNASPDKLALARVSIALLREEQTMIGDVLCTPSRVLRDGHRWREWTFRKAPPRRAT